MVISNNYVSLPEGIYIWIYHITHLGQFLSSKPHSTYEQKKRFPSSPSREAMAQYQPWAICKSTTPMENCWYIGILYIEYNMYNGILYIADILEYNLYNAKWCSASHVMGLRSHAGLVKSKSYTLQPKTCAGTVGVRHDTCLRRCSSLNNLDVIWKNECVHFPHQI